MGTVMVCADIAAPAIPCTIGGEQLGAVAASARGPMPQRSQPELFTEYPAPTEHRAESRRSQQSASAGRRVARDRQAAASTAMSFRSSDRLGNAVFTTFRRVRSMNTARGHETNDNRLDFGGLRLSGGVGICKVDAQCSSRNIGR